MKYLKQTNLSADLLYGQVSDGSTASVDCSSVSQVRLSFGISLSCVYCAAGHHPHLHFTVISSTDQVVAGGCYSKVSYTLFMTQHSFTAHLKDINDHYPLYNSTVHVPLVRKKLKNGPS